MEIAGLLAKEQLQSIFLNLDELTAVNTKFSEKLQDALDIAMEHGDEVSRMNLKIWMAEITEIEAKLQEIAVCFNSLIMVLLETLFNDKWYRV